MVFTLSSRRPKLVWQPCKVWVITCAALPSWDWSLVGCWLRPEAYSTLCPLSELCAQLCSAGLRSVWQYSTRSERHALLVLDSYARRAGSEVN